MTFRHVFLALPFLVTSFAAFGGWVVNESRSSVAELHHDFAIHSAKHDQDVADLRREAAQDRDTYLREVTGIRADFREAMKPFLLVHPAKGGR